MICVDKITISSGIYSLIHSESGRRYVGSSLNIKKRIKWHIWRANSGWNMCIHRAMRQFGIDSFSCEILEECNKDNLLEREAHWIAFFNAASVNGFNTMAKPTAIYDRVTSDATKARISAAKKGHVVTAETRMKLSIANTGKKFPAASIAKKGKRLSAESIEKRSATMRMIRMLGDVLRGKVQKSDIRTISLMQQPHKKRYVATDRHRANMALAHIGSKRTPEQMAHLKNVMNSPSVKSKLGSANRGKHLSDEHKAKIGASNKNKIRSPEQRLAASKATKAHYASKSTSQQSFNLA